MERAWIFPAAAIVAAEYGVALAIGAAAGFHYSIPLGAYLIVALTIAAASLTAALLLRVGQLATAGEQHPVARLKADGQANRERLTAFALGVVLVGLQMGVLTWLKVMLPIVVPFWADGLLGQVDRLLFGTDPWRLTAGAVPWASGLVDRVYVSWAPVKLATLFLLLCAPGSAAKARAMLSYFLIVAAVAIGQYALSSAGPLFQPGFADMTLQPWVAAARDYLVEDYRRGGGHIGSGISAMPSLHVAIALWVALVSRAYWPRLQVLGWAYFALIAFGSVALGWHYAADSIVGALITLAGWKLARRRVERVKGIEPSS